jgi:hypothetical protein
MLTREAIAYEEVGHAVAATVLSVPFIDVTIWDWGGTVRRIEPPPGSKPDEEFIVIKLAGPLARLRFDPNSSPGGPDDIDEAKQWVPDDTTYELLAAEAESIVNTHWQVIEYVVKTLLKQKRAADGGQTLSARAIRAAMKRAGWFAGQW